MRIIATITAALAALVFTGTAGASQACPALYVTAQRGALATASVPCRTQRTILPEVYVNGHRLTTSNLGDYTWNVTYYGDDTVVHLDVKGAIHARVSTLLATARVRVRVIYYNG